MELSSINQFLLLASWFAFAGLNFILALIARFYEKLSGKKTYYPFYAIPVFTAALSIARYVSIGRWGDDWLGDGLAGLGGLILLVLCYQLYRNMTTTKRK